MYTAPTVRTSYSSIPTSTITAQAVVMDGFALSQMDNAGITNTASRSYTATGITMVNVDGRNNATTTVTDLAGRTVSVTDAANHTTTTVYDTVHDLPAEVTDAEGNTACYKYDNRGRKIAELTKKSCKLNEFQKSNDFNYSAGYIITTNGQFA